MMTAKQRTKTSNETKASPIEPERLDGTQVSRFHTSSLT
jgi:hypothetical protein